jgi:outer membrane protein assembly factor BamB
LGKSCPLSAPVIVDDSTVIVGCDDSLKIIDISNNQVLSSVKGNTKSIRPVVGPGNMIYVVLDDNICQITPQGSAVWKTKITDGTGKYLVLDEESGLYSINSKGNLYKYDLIDGSESLISNSTFT